MPDIMSDFMIMRHMMYILHFFVGHFGKRKRYALRLNRRTCVYTRHKNTVVINCKTKSIRCGSQYYVHVIALLSL